MGMTPRSLPGAATPDRLKKGNRCDLWKSGTRLSVSKCSSDCRTAGAKGGAGSSRQVARRDTMPLVSEQSEFRAPVGKLVVSLALLAMLVWGQPLAQPERYRELRRVIDQNTGFAHMTRGVNMYTLYALRSCVGVRDLPVLRDMLRDKDRVTRMAVSSVLVDLGGEGERVVRTRLAEVKDAGEKLMLEDALGDLARPDHRPILEYPLTAAERARIHGCK